MRLLSVAEPTDDTASGFLLRGMKGVINHFYLLNLAEEVKKGLNENAMKCLHTGGIPPYGYNVGPDKKLVINPLEAEAVKLIFKMYGDNHGYREIVKTLDAKGYKPRRSKYFCINTVREMLKNDK